MTVAELLQALQTLPEDAQVLVQGYETGWDSIDRLVEAQAVQNPEQSDWDGEYGLIGKVDPLMAHGEPIHVVLLVGRRGHRQQSG
jgi:hypothetical protein